MNEKCPIDRSKVTITRGDPRTDFWLSGKVNEYPGYRFEAKVYDVGGQFGIKGGRISKLSVWHGSDKSMVINYQRGWATRPQSPEQHKVLEAIVGAFPERDRALGQRPLKIEKVKVKREHSRNRSFSRSGDIRRDRDFSFER